MLGRKLNRRSSRVVTAALLIVAGAVFASYGSTLISLKIDASNLVPTADIAGLFVDDGGNSSDVDIDYAPVALPSADFANVGDTQFIKIGSLNVVTGEAIIDPVDTIANGGPGYFVYAGSLAAALQTTASGNYFGLASQNFSTENGYSAGQTGEPGGFFFGMAQLDAGGKTVTYTGASGITATFDFAFRRPDGTMGSVVGDGGFATDDDVVLQATLVSFMIPEPSTIALLGFSLAGVALLRRRRR